MTPEQMRLLYEYNAWANHRTLDACAALTPEQLAQRIESSFPSVRDTLVHIVAAEWIWLERWQGRSPSAAEWEQFGHQFTGLESVRAFWAGIEGKQTEFVTALTPEQLARVQEIRTTEGKTYAQPLWQMMQHLANHSTYHRGQVTTMLRQLGAKPVATDLIAFYRQRAT